MPPNSTCGLGLGWPSSLQAYISMNAFCAERGNHFCLLFMSSPSPEEPSQQATCLVLPWLRVRSRWELEVERLP